MVTCTKCGLSKPREQFVIDKRRPAGYTPTRCRDCHNAQLRANKDARRVWHQCSWCGAERFIDRRHAAADPLCLNDQRLDILQRARARQYFESLWKPEQEAWKRVRKYSREVIRDLTRVHKRVARELQWIKVRKPRMCPTCDASFTTDSWTKVYCSDVCAGRSFKNAAESKYGRFRVSRSRRDAIYERDGWLCFCGSPVIPWGSSEDPYDPLYATLDHIQPRSLGGSDDDENLRTAHFGCNSERGADPDWELELRAA